eukprot:m.230175 g.230175  ORF g.230175 m.230175 type:complete len:234 (-) comp17943_c0_seq1:31-732(-)
MVRLTQDVIVMAPQFTNTMKEREIDLRGNKIGTIENLGATLDQFDTIDLSDNDIRKVEGFPLLKRLKTVNLSNNRVVKIGDGIATSLPHLEELVLTNNQIAELGDLDPLGTIPTITRLSLLSNPVSRLKHYRLYVIHLMPNLRTLDFQRVKPKEKSDAQELFGGSSGARTKEEFVKRSTYSAAAIAAPAEEAAPSKDVEAIKAAILNAKSLEEVQQLEMQLKAGVVPEKLESA